MAGTEAEMSDYTRTQIQTGDNGGGRRVLERNEDEFCSTLSEVRRHHWQYLPANINRSSADTDMFYCIYCLQYREKPYR